MTTTLTTAGRGDDFTATAACSCGWSHAETLADDGDMAAAFELAEAAEREHQTDHAWSQARVSV
jgi:hypothetical protein